MENCATLQLDSFGGRLGPLPLLVAVKDRDELWRLAVDAAVHCLGIREGQRGIGLQARGAVTRDVAPVATGVATRPAADSGAAVGMEKPTLCPALADASVAEIVANVGRRQLLAWRLPSGSAAARVRIVCISLAPKKESKRRKKR